MRENKNKSKMKLVDKSIVFIFLERLHFHQIFWHQPVLNFANLQFKVANTNEFRNSSKAFAIPCLQCIKPDMLHRPFRYCMCHSALHTIWNFGKRKRIVTAHNYLSFKIFSPVAIGVQGGCQFFPSATCYCPPLGGVRPKFFATCLFLAKIFCYYIYFPLFAATSLGRVGISDI